MLMPYGQNERGDFISIDINTLRAKEQTKFKQFRKIEAGPMDQPLFVYISNLKF